MTTKEREDLNKVTEACEKEGWGVEIHDDHIWLTNQSPLGEDISFEISLDTPARDIQEEYENFDVDEHVELLVPMRGTHGVPSSIISLCHDAEEIEKMLMDLFTAVQKVA